MPPTRPPPQYQCNMTSQPIQPLSHFPLVATDSSALRAHNVFAALPCAALHSCAFAFAFHLALAHVRLMRVPALDKSTTLSISGLDMQITTLILVLNTFATHQNKFAFQKRSLHHGTGIGKLPAAFHRVAGYGQQCSCGGPQQAGPHRPRL